MSSDVYVFGGNSWTNPLLHTARMKYDILPPSALVHRTNSQSTTKLLQWLIINGPINVRRVDCNLLCQKCCKFNIYVYIQYTYTPRSSKCVKLVFSFGRLFVGEKAQTVRTWKVQCCSYLFRHSRVTNAVRGTPLLGRHLHAGRRMFEPRSSADRGYGFQFHKQFSWFGKAGVGKPPEEKKAQGCGEVWWSVHAFHCKQIIVKQCI